MNPHETPGTATRPLGADEVARMESTATPLDHGHIVGPEGTFDNPGLPPHVPRAADVDEGFAKRAERQVVSMFALSVLGTIGFLVAFFTVDPAAMTFFPFFGNINLQHTLFGVCLAVALLGIGLGTVHWAKTLMPDTEVVEERHPTATDEAGRREFAAALDQGIKGAQLDRRPLIKTFGITAAGLFALPPLVQLVAGLGKAPGSQLHETFWQKGMRLVRDPELTPIKASDVTMGSVFHVLPEGIDGPKKKPAKGEDFHHDEDLGVLERKTKAAVLLIRLDPELIKSEKARSWGYQGIVAYNKICTHAGCPVGLYEQQTHHLLCPCHQSTFDVTKDCEVVFGPAKRPLPQLKITVDSQGYLVADAPFAEPVGPSFWDR